MYETTSAMTKVERDEAREERITMEIVVDAYGPEEQAIGWHCYLDDVLQFPFTAICIDKRRISPLKKDQAVKVTGMAPEEECEHEMFVEIDGDGDTLAVPLAQLGFKSGDGELSEEMEEETREAIEDWNYWVKRGYEFG